MRIVFMGTPQFAVPSLQKLLENDYDICAVYTRPDAKSGRGNKLIPSPVKTFAQQYNLDIFTLQTLRDTNVQLHIKSLQPDFIVVAAYGAILPQEVLDIPKHGCINVHGSLLPRWRGAAPVQRAILAGDEYAGVCIMQMETGLDTGAYCEVGRTKIAHKSSEELSEEIAQMGACGLIDALPQICASSYPWQTQDETLVTYAEKIKKEETLLDPSLNVQEFCRRVQASSKSAPARCIVCDKEITVIKASPVDKSLNAGEVLLEKKKIILGLNDACVQLLTIKPQGKKEMPVTSWIAGLRPRVLTWHSVQMPGVEQ